MAGDRGLRCGRWIVTPVAIWPDRDLVEPWVIENILVGQWRRLDLCGNVAADHAGYPLREIRRIDGLAPHQGHDGATHGCGACQRFHQPQQSAFHIAELGDLPAIGGDDQNPAAIVLSFLPALHPVVGQMHIGREWPELSPICLRHIECQCATFAGLGQVHRVLRQRPQRHLTEMIGQPVGHQGIGLPGVAHLVGEPAPRNASACLPGFVATGQPRDAGLPLQPFHEGLHPIVAEGKHAALRIRPRLVAEGIHTGGDDGA